MIVPFSHDWVTTYLGLSQQWGTVAHSGSLVACPEMTSIYRLPVMEKLSHFFLLFCSLFVLVDNEHMLIFVLCPEFSIDYGVVFCSIMLLVFCFNIHAR